jgi:uncharacterized tellurite resistance protein B-like protein
MKQSSINSIDQNVCFQMGLLHFTHLLMTSDGVIDERERLALEQIMEEENIPEMIFRDFQDNVVHKTEKQTYEDGVDLLSRCTDQEKLCAIVHLFRLSEADDAIHEKEVRLLFYSLKGTDVDFEDVELTARLVKAAKKPIQVAVK